MVYIKPTPPICGNTNIILMTDGEPTFDTDANTGIKDLWAEKGVTISNCNSYINGFGDPEENCMPELAEYLYEQEVLTYTIGFATDQVLLQDTADKGQGKGPGLGVYATADSAEELAAAFEAALLEILEDPGTFTSPAIAVDSFNRTRSRDDLILAMYKPSNGTRWSGNIKKLKVNVDSLTGKAEIQDANGQPAIDNTTGQIKVTAQTFWSTTQDGPDVEKGGAGALLAARNPIQPQNQDQYRGQRQTGRFRKQ